jgi:hypothetical protein
MKNIFYVSCQNEMIVISNQYNVTIGYDSNGNVLESNIFQNDNTKKFFALAKKHLIEKQFLTK